MCKVRKIHLLAINGLMWTAIGTKISITGISHYLTTPAEKLWWMIPLSVLVFAGFVVVSALSMLLLAKAAKTIPIGTAYPVWTGIGAIGTVLIGILVFKEPASFWRLFFIFTLIASVIGLRMV